MAIDRTRRKLLSMLAAGFATPAGSLGFSTSRTMIDGDDRTANDRWPDLLCSWEEDTVHHVGTWSRSSGARGVALPFRVHGLRVDPGDVRRAIAVARRPGDYLVRFGLHDGGDLQFEKADSDRVFNGHAEFSSDGRLLYTSENRTEDGSGAIGVRDAATLAKRTELATHGIEPHALLPEPAHSLLVANGGILTLPATGRTKLDPDHMDPSLVRLDAREGRLIGQWRLADRKLSIRHLAHSPQHGIVGIALQAEHADLEQRDHATLLALFDGASLRLASKPADQKLGGYGGDVTCFTCERRSYFAVSCTRAGLIAFWDHDGQWVGTVRHEDACALTQYGDGIIAAGEKGALVRIANVQAHSRIAPTASLKWDNHIATASSG